MGIFTIQLTVLVVLQYDTSPVEWSNIYRNTLNNLSYNEFRLAYIMPPSMSCCHKLDQVFVIVPSGYGS